MNTPITDPAISLDVKKLLEDCGAILRGHFKLSSGLHSDTYCQCARLFEDPAATKLAAKLLKEKLLPRTLRPQTVVGPAMGGIIWGYQLAEQTNATSVFCERVDGSFQLRRGFEIPEGERVIIAEDVVTTGKSVKEAIELVNATGAKVIAVAVVVDRSKGTFDAGTNVDNEPIPTYALCDMDFNTWTEEECPMVQQGIPVQTPGSRKLRGG